MPEDTGRIQWEPIRPLRPADARVNGAIGALEALRAEWLRRLEALSESERNAIRQRTLRRLAIETGILERLYDLDWGLTLTLVAEGLTRDVVERAGGRVDERTLATLRAHMDSLGLVVEFVRADRPLTPFFIKELHQALTRTQATYTATDALGRTFDRELPKGVWKKDPNHVLRSDHRILEYCPPEQVASEMDNLTEMWAQLDATATHPLVKAAWLHHRFVQIHPFADGNGRVARALTLLVVEKYRYAPLVIDRHHRTRYLLALDRANDGELGDLVGLFARLESGALASELERPFEAPKGLSVEVAHTLAEQLAHRRALAREAVALKLDALSRAVIGRMDVWFARKRAELEDIFRSRGLGDVKVLFDSQLPPSEKAQWFRVQAIRAAHFAGHYADFTGFTGSCCLRIRVQELQLRYIAAVHGAGRDTGVMAVVTFGDIGPRAGGASAEGTDRLAPVEFETTHDAFRFVHTESVSDLDARGGELDELLEEGLTEALAKLLAQV